MARLRARVAALNKRKQCDRGDDRKCHRRSDSEREQLSLPPVRLPPLALQSPLQPPRAHWLGEHVVKDLVTVGSVDGAEDPLPVQRREHRQQRCLRHRRVLREVAHPMRHLRSRRRHEMVEHACRDVLLVSVEHVECAFQVLANDRLRPAERSQRRELQRRRTGGNFLFHSRSSTSCRYGASMRPPRSATPATSSSTASTRAGSTSTDSPVSSFNARRDQDRCACGLSIEMLESQL